MQLTIKIEDEVMRDLMRCTGATTTAAAVNEALAGWVCLRKREEIKALRGKLPVEGDLAALRRMESPEMCGAESSRVGVQP